MFSFLSNRNNYTTGYGYRTPSAATLDAAYVDTTSRPAGNSFAPEQHVGACFSTVLFAADLPWGCADPCSTGNTIETSRVDLVNGSSLSLAIHAEIGMRLPHSNSG